MKTFLLAMMCAAAGAAFAQADRVVVLEGAFREDLVWRARWIGELLREEIEEILLEVLGSAVHEVRGLGLLIGIELTVDGLAGELLLELMEAGVIANHSLNSDRVLRLTPPGARPAGPADVARQDLDVVHLHADAHVAALAAFAAAEASSKSAITKACGM